MKANLENGNELKQTHGLFRSQDHAKQIAGTWSEQDKFDYIVACEKEIRENMTQVLPARDYALANAVEFVANL